MNSHQVSSASGHYPGAGDLSHWFNSPALSEILFIFPLYHLELCSGCCFLAFLQIPHCPRVSQITTTVPNKSELIFSTLNSPIFRIQVLPGVQWCKQEQFHGRQWRQSWSMLLALDYGSQQSPGTAALTARCVMDPSTEVRIKDIFQPFNWIWKCHSNSGSTSLTPVQICLWWLDAILSTIKWLKWPEKGICFPFQFPESFEEVNKASSPCYFCSRQNLPCISPSLVVNLPRYEGVQCCGH